MLTMYEKVTKALPKLLANAGTNDPFQARVFKDISVYAGALADELPCKSESHPSQRT